MRPISGSRRLVEGYRGSIAEWKATGERDALKHKGISSSLTWVSSNSTGDRGDGTGQRTGLSAQ